MIQKIAANISSITESQFIYLHKLIFKINYPKECYLFNDCKYEIDKS